MSHRIAHTLRNKWRSSDIRSEIKYTFITFVQDSQILSGLKAAGFRRPSPVQIRAIPEAALGKDLIVQSKSGTGKTCFFVIRALECLNEDIGDLQVLIISPTREIAWQIYQVVQSIGMYFKKLNCETFIGGLPAADDVDKAFDCQIAVGTPGRLRHMIHLEHLDTKSIKLLVLDEADQLMTQSFLEDVNYIIDRLPKSRQTLAVSATFTDDVISVYDQHMRNPKVISVYEEELALKGVVQFYHVFECGDYVDIYQKKFEVLLKILNSVSFAQCMVFTSSLSEVQAIFRDLKNNRHAVGSISSQDDQDKRLKTMDSLKESKIKVLVTSDLTARGIDAENVNLVLSMDPASNMETYVHRVGRAGRYGSRGVSVVLMTDGREVQKLLRYKIRGNLTVYPLPDPIPYYLKKYEPPSPELEMDILKYEVKSSYYLNKNKRNGNSLQDSADRKSTAKSSDGQDEDASQHSSSSKLPAVSDGEVDVNVQHSNDSSSECPVPSSSDADLPDVSVEGYMNPLEVKDNDKMMEKLFTLISEGETSDVDGEDCHPISNSEGAGILDSDHTYCQALNGEDMLGVSNEDTKTDDFADHDERGMLTEFNRGCGNNQDNFSCNDFFFDASIEPVEENNLIKDLPQLSSDIKIVETGDEDFNKGGLNDGVSLKIDEKEGSSTSNVPEISADKNNDLDVCNSDLQHITSNVESNNASKEEINSEHLSTVPHQKNGTSSNASDETSAEKNNDLDVCNSDLQHITSNAESNNASKEEINSEHLSAVPHQKNATSSNASHETSVENCCNLPPDSMVKETPNVSSAHKSKQPDKVNGNGRRGKYGVESNGYKEFRRLTDFANHLHDKKMQAKPPKTAAKKLHSKNVSSQGHEMTLTPKVDKKAANNKSCIENSKCVDLPQMEKNDLKAQNKESQGLKMDEREESFTLNGPEIFSEKSIGLLACNSGMPHVTNNVESNNACKEEINPEHLSTVPHQKNETSSNASDQKSVENCCNLPFNSMAKATPNVSSEHKSKQPDKINEKKGKYGVESEGHKEYIRLSDFANHLHDKKMAQRMQAKPPQTAAEKLHSKKVFSEEHKMTLIPKMDKMATSNRSGIENSKCKELSQMEKNDLKSQNKESSQGAILKKKDLASSNKKTDIKSGQRFVDGSTGESNLREKYYKSKDTIHEKYSSPQAVREPYCYDSRNMAADSDSETDYRPRVRSSGVHGHRDGVRVCDNHRDGVRFCDNHHQDSIRSCSDHDMRSCSDRNMRSCSDRNMRCCSDRNMRCCSDRNMRCCSDRNMRCCCDRNMRSCYDRNMRSCYDRNMRSCNNHNVRSCCNHNIRSCCDHFDNGQFRYDHHNSGRSFCDRDMRSHSDHCNDGCFHYDHNCASSGYDDYHHDSLRSCCDHHHDSVRSCCDHHSRRSQCDYPNGHNHHHSSISQQMTRDANYHDSSCRFYDCIPPTLPFPFVYLDEQHDEDFDYGKVLHEALLMSLK